LLDIELTVEQRGFHIVDSHCSFFLAADAALKLNMLRSRLTRNESASCAFKK
jgi:hypothetical protein